MVRAAQPKTPKKRGRKPNPNKPRTVRVAIAQALYANLKTLADDFGHGRDVADVMRALARDYVARLQDEKRLPDKPLKPPSED